MLQFLYDKEVGTTMKRTLTITFEFDDGSWMDEETGKEYPPIDAIAYAMEHVNRSVPYANCDEFVDAKLDGEVLVDRRGYISDEVRQRKMACWAFMKEIASRFSDSH